MMIPAQGYAAPIAKAPLAPFQFQRRAPGDNDVVIDLEYCGICHSDIHQARDEWGGATFPMVPGHEIIGVVRAIGAAVTRVRPGERVGVGCMVDSCRTCGSCQAGFEQYCSVKVCWSYNSTERDGVTPTYGGYSDVMVVDERYVLRVPEGLPAAAAAPLLCAGITTYSPLRAWQVGPGQRVGVVGIGGLGHMALRLIRALGAQPVAITTSPSKAQDARRLGADEVIVSTERHAMARARGRLDLIINTVAGRHDLRALLELLRLDGTMVLVGIPEKPHAVDASPLIMKRRRLAGSLIGGIAETQEMLDLCGRHNIVADVETIPISQVNEAYERTLRGDVRYRFVIDLASLA